MKLSTHDITVNYLGLELCSPLIPSASPLQGYARLEVPTWRDEVPINAQLHLKT